VRTGFLHLGQVIWLVLSLSALPLRAELNEGGIKIQPESPPPAVDFGKPGEVDPGKAAVPEHTDRKKSQAMAAAMAAQTAAMQNMTCMMMMKEAMKSGGSDKTMMMAMAMQQCAQAAQTMANAAENRKNEGKVEADPGKPASYKAGEFKAPAAQKDQATVDVGAPSQSGGEESTPAPDPVVAAAPDIPSFTPSPTPVAAGETPPPGTTGIVELGGIPGTIETTKLGYDETGKSGNNPTPDRQLASGSSVATAKPGGEAGVDKTPGNITSLGALGGRKKGGSAPEDAGGGSGGEEKSGDGSSPLDAMLATLLGGGAAAEAGSDGSNGQELATMETDEKNAKPGPNIFEYATYRYKKVTYDEGKIKVRRPKAPLATATSATTAMAKP